MKFNFSRRSVDDVKLTIKYEERMEGVLMGEMRNASSKLFDHILPI